MLFLTCVGMIDAFPSSSERGRGGASRRLARRVRVSGFEQTWDPHPPLRRGLSQRERGMRPSTYENTCPQTPLQNNCYANHRTIPYVDLIRPGEQLVNPHLS